MTVAPPDLPVPPQVARIAAGRAVVAVWRNGIGGTTWRLDAPGRTTYVKIGPRHPEFDVGVHLERLAWVGRYVAAPRLVADGESDGLLWFETEALPGYGLVSGHFGPDGPFAGRQADIAAALGRALRRFHDSVPVDDCRWTWSIEDRLAFRPLPRAAELANHPPIDAVVCHGDACNPNFLLDDSLECTGYVDLGQLGVADRWADIAAATLSLGWNYGEGYTEPFLSGYGIDLDVERLAYYRRLWNAEEESFAATSGAGAIH